MTYLNSISLNNYNVQLFQKPYFESISVVAIPFTRNFSKATIFGAFTDNFKTFTLFSYSHLNEDSEIIFI